MSITKRQLLIIEDETEIAELIESMLEEYFTITYHAESLEKGKSFLYQYRFQLIVLDINLSGKNGAEILKFLSENPLNPNVKTPILLVSGIITQEFILRFHQKFAGILAKPFSEEDLIKKVISILPELSKDNTYQSIESLNLIPVDVNGPFPIPSIENEYIEYLNSLSKKPRLKHLFMQVKISKPDDDYFYQHIGRLINTSLSLAILLGWPKEKVLEKFICAAYLHDLSLIKHPELAKIHSFEYIDNHQLELGIDRYNLVLNHSEISYKEVDRNPEVPPDVANIIRSHHEESHGKGFPFHGNHFKIPPLSAIFIVAHEFVDFMYDNPNWTVQLFIETKKAVYQGQYFLKILNAFSEIELKGV